SSPLNASYIGPIVYHADSGGVADREHISDLELVNRVRTGQVTYTDYNYEQPKIPQEMTHAGDLDQDLKQFDYPGRYVDPVMGQVRTTEWMSEHIVDNQQVEASSDVMRLASGYSF
ncbi:contractile injection system protein, VgrG/Pvc8 family, partial [Vibrio parahaemolyticus]